MSNPSDIIQYHCSCGQWFLTPGELQNHRMEMHELQANASELFVVKQQWQPIPTEKEVPVMVGGGGRGDAQQSGFIGTGGGGGASRPKWEAVEPSFEPLRTFASLTMIELAQELAKLDEVCFNDLMHKLYTIKAVEYWNGRR